MVMTRLGLVGLGLLAAGILTACSAGTDFKRPERGNVPAGPDDREGDPRAIRGAP
jgi:hypothetical protein